MECENGCSNVNETISVPTAMKAQTYYFEDNDSSLDDSSCEETSILTSSQYIQEYSEYYMIPQRSSQPMPDDDCIEDSMSSEQDCEIEPYEYHNTSNYNNYYNANYSNTQFSFDF